MATILTQVRLATTVNIDLTANLNIGVSKIDDIFVSSNDRILVKAQSNKAQNGIYTVNSSGVWARAADWANGSSQTPSTVVFVREGTLFADTGWVLKTDGDITVGTTPVEWERFSLNLNINGADLPSSIVLRKEKGFPLTNDELDNNFKYLSVSLTEKLNVDQFTGLTVSLKLGEITAQEANVNAWLLRGSSPSQNSSASTIVQRTVDGDIYANQFFGNLSGNASTATSATYALTAGNISGNGIVPLTNGGTGGNTAASARASLGVVSISGDTMTGKLSLPAATTESASLRVTPSAATISAPLNGDIWGTTEALYFRGSSSTKTIAFLESPAFTGSPTVPTADISSNSTAVASTAYVQLHRTAVDTAIALKANINSPAFTGTPTSTTPATSDNSTKIATTAYTVAKINDVLSSYSTTAQVNSSITNALTAYSTTTQVNSSISNSLTNYYTKSQIDTTIALYSTTSAMNTAITNAVSPKANTTYVDGLQDKWGTSRKFVQSTTPTSPSEGDFWFKI